MRPRAAVYNDRDFAGCSGRWNGTEPLTNDEDPVRVRVRTGSVDDQRSGQLSVGTATLREQRIGGLAPVVIRARCPGLEPELQALSRRHGNEFILRERTRSDAVQLHGNGQPVAHEHMDLGSHRNTDERSGNVRGTTFESEGVDIAHWSFG